jgi:3-oxoadipate enol-lactonase
LVLLHPLGVDHHFWDFASVFEDEFTLCLYDLPGHGATIAPREPYSIADLSTHLADVLEENRITQAHIAGISLGGLIALDFAANFPQQVAKLILIATTARQTDEMRAIWIDQSATAYSAGVKVLVPDLLKMWFSAPFLDRNSPAVEYIRAALSHCSGKGYALACDALAKAELRQDVDRIEAPTLVMCGKDDLPCFLDGAQWLADHISNAKLAWVADARHAAVLEQPGVALALMRDFLK